ncbi:MAG: isoleucine--tRNA ligase [Erysipelotrichaceae bacterium]|nr:isoleucine--tRNA ligase [Erysipelotrichaceae bacterium]
MDYKETIFLPKTNFEMRGNLPVKEPSIQNFWEENDIYQKMLASNDVSKAFYLHDGPPYANGNMHTGHALNKILKDIVIRYKNMNGFYAPIIHGWDTHGMPIEVALQKKGFSTKNMDAASFRNKCRDFAISQVKIQRKQVKRLGVCGNFGSEDRLLDESDETRPYLTLHKQFEAKQIQVFAQMALKGYIYKGLKTVHWSPSSQTALAEAEIEYYDVESYSIYVAFKVLDGKGILDSDTSFIIWTTTPWTIPSNLAICVNPRFEYGLYETNKGKFVFDVVLADEIIKQLEFENVKLLKVFKGHELEYITASHPYFDRSSLVILGDYVTEDSGTGIVHIAPDHGMDDFMVAKKYGIHPFVPIDARGCYTSVVGKDFEGVYFEDGNEISLNKMKETNTLLNVSKFTHSYPHDWRTKKPLIQRATDQWFCSIDVFKDQLLNEVHNTKWYPSWGELRMNNMIKDREDWCISRQRTWGVPIPIIYNEDDSPIIEKEVFDHISNMFAKYGANCWYEMSAKELLPENYKNDKSPNGNFYKEKDIMDVWFDSGSSSMAVMEQRENVYPADLYLEGFDQYRGWFNSSLITGCAINNKAPYKAVVSHGFVLDGEGRKMSKSLGNTIDPNQLVNKYGADILRIWAASCDYQADMRISEDIVKQCADSYKSIRNRFKFMLGTLSDFSYQDNKVDNLTFVDQCIINELNDLVNKCHEFYDSYDFAMALSLIVNFLQIDLSGFYLDMAKDILYCDAINSNRRRQVQTVIYEVCYTLMQLLAPIIPHTAEEIYQNFVGKDKESVFLTKYNYERKDVDLSLKEQYKRFMTLRNIVLKALEEKRAEKIIGKSIDATILLHVKDELLKDIINNMDEDTLQHIFIVSKVVLKNCDCELVDYGVASVKVIENKGIICERCWNRIDEDKICENSLCKRCYDVIKEQKND